MKRSGVVAAALTAALLVAVVGLPAGAGSPADPKSPGPQVARLAPVGGVLTLSRLKIANSDSAAPDAGWVSAGSMVTAVDTPGGGAFKGGRVYVPGGIKADGTQQDRMQTYSAAANVWVQDTADVMLAGFPHADMAVCADPAAGGKIYAVNGHDNSFIYAALQVYNPAAPAGSRWAAASYPSYADPAACPTDGNCYYFSQGSGCAVIGGKLYLFGGYGAVGDLAAPAAVTNETWVYDIATDTWSDYGTGPTSHMVTPRFWGGYASNATTIFAAGGTDNTVTFAPVATTERFTVAGGWVAMGSVPLANARIGNGVGVLGPYRFIIGGATFNGTAFTVRNTSLFCSGGCTSWGPFPYNLASARWFFGWASGNAGSNRLYVAGGSDGVTDISSAERFQAP